MDEPIELTKEEEIDKLWRRINELRIMWGYTWIGLSGAVGNAGFFNRRGHDMKIQTLVKLANTFQVPISDLFSDDRPRLLREEWGYVVVMKRPTGTISVVGTFMDIKKAKKMFVNMSKYKKIQGSADSFLDMVTGDVYTITKSKVDYEHVF